MSDTGATAPDVNSASDTSNDVPLVSSDTADLAAPASTEGNVPPTLPTAPATDSAPDAEDDASAATDSSADEAEPTDEDDPMGSKDPLQVGTTEGDISDGSEQKE
ncbi:MAG: hypothetical protein JWQ43_2698 [Glaciihabitans sp.]|nr:hypothetical protein [Glaciihabitans sp.]